MGVCGGGGGSGWGGLGWPSSMVSPLVPDDLGQSLQCSYISSQAHIYLLERNTYQCLLVASNSSSGHHALLAEAPPSSSSDNLKMR